MSTILIVDDEKNMRVSLKAILEDHGYEILLAESGEAALRCFDQQTFDLIILDLKMSGMTGLQLLAILKEKKSKTPVILITAYATPKSAVEAIKLGALDYIPKPFDPEEIIFSVQKALDYLRIKKENIDLKGSFRSQKALTDIIGEDASVNAVRKMIETVAPTKAIVLIRGESGTGKELIAKAIHELSLQRDREFVPVNCAAIPENLLESELFGHEKGSFTGAIYTKKGKFEIADGGTIYLDEIGDMSLALQAKILRVLEDGRFERVGGIAPITSQARVVTATNKDLKKAIQEGSFREDLFFRLNVITIEIPPLRERISDIPRLIDHFIQRYNVEFGKNLKGIHSDALKHLTSYSWPGNVRELKNTIERAVLLEGADRINTSSFPREIMEVAETTQNDKSIHGGLDFKSAVSNYEKQIIQWALKKSNNKVGIAAEMLGLTRHSLRHYLLKYFKGMRDIDAE